MTNITSQSASACQSDSTIVGVPRGRFRFRLLPIGYLTIAALALAGALGCESDPPAQEPPKSTASTPPAAASSPAPTATPSTARPTPKEAKVAAITTMQAFVEAASASKLVLTDYKIHSEESDPNKLLGRPGQYLAKMNWKIDGGDATIEVFADAEGAKTRAAYIENIGKGAPMFLEYVFTHPTRFAVLRLPKALAPTKAKEWEAMLLAI